MSPERVALVTGAGSGIGRATAIEFSRRGYAVVIADSDAAGGAESARQIAARDGTGVFIRCDVSDEASVRQLIERATKEFGRLDAAFNNAGIEGAVASTADCSTQNFDRVIAVDLRGVWLCMREEIRHMLAHGGGAIVNCSSVAGLVGLPGIPAYAAAKHGVIGLTRTAALEYAAHGIRVNAVCPGAIETPMLDRFLGSTAGARESTLRAEPIGRFGGAEEIADAVVWLCGGASFVTGQAIAVDGGWTAA